VCEEHLINLENIFPFKDPFVQWKGFMDVLHKTISVVTSIYFPLDMEYR